MPRMRKSRGKELPIPFIATFELTDEVAAEAEEETPVWVQVASSGEYKGYAGGEMTFTFDEEVFNNLVANFRKHPSFAMGANGVGSSDVVAWDFHHASEMPPTEGNIAAQGAPAQGWVRDLAVRKSADGKAQLWALTNWLEPARSYIKDKRYRWASVSVVFDAVDPISGENVGAVLTSIALTNSPFIEGMQPLAADKHAAAMNLRRYFDMYLEAADGPERAMEMIRKMLGLPETADAVAVAAELEKVRQWSASGEAPLGVDVDELVGGLRTILNLPSLSTTEEVMAEADKLIARLQSDSGVGDEGAPAEPPPAPAAPPPMTPPAEPAPMERNDTMSLLNAIAEKLGVQAQDKAVLEALDQLTELRAVTASSLGLDDTASTKVICKATLSDAEVRAKYGPVLEALGVENPDAALEKVGELMTKAEELAKVSPELAALRKTAEEAEEAEAEDDVEEAMASMSIAKDSPNYAGIRLSVAHYRKTHTQKEFLEKYPKTEPEKRHLTKSITADTKGAGDAAKRSAKDGGEKDAIDVSAYPGANPILKACNFVRATIQGADKWEWQAIHEHASALVRAGKVTAEA